MINLLIVLLFIYRKKTKKEARVLTLIQMQNLNKCWLKPMNRRPSLPTQELMSQHHRKWMIQINLYVLF